MNVVLHQFERFDFWTMCKFVWGVCVWVDSLVRCQCQRIFVFPCRRNRQHRHRILFLQFPFSMKKKVYTLPFIWNRVLFPKTVCFCLSTVFGLSPFCFAVSFSNVLKTITKKKEKKKMCACLSDTQMKTKLRD